MQTPLMTQYHRIKQSNPDTILLFRVGDFFETFDEDAKTASKVLGITLTRRSNGAAGDTPLAGFPHHAIDTYLPKLVRAGYRVAICEQMEDPKKAKGIVKREVVEVVTPGVAFSDKLLDHKKNNYLLAISLKEDIAGIAFSDISTGEFFVFETPVSKLRDSIDLVSPSEIIGTKKQLETVKESLSHSATGEVRFTKIDEWVFNRDYARETLTMQFKTASLKGFGIEHLDAGLLAAGAVLYYLSDTQKSALPHIQSVALYNPSDFMTLDFATKRNLEIVFSMHDGGKSGSLIGILDKTETPMGGRLLKKWIAAPLKRLEPILQRQEAVEEFYRRGELRKTVSEALRETGDLERLISKVCTGRVNPRELVHLHTALTKLPLLQQTLLSADSRTLKGTGEKLILLPEVTDAVGRTLVDFPPAAILEGGVVRGGYSAELDELREIRINGKTWIAEYQKGERERTGISSLKVSYNKVFGYYIEITNANLDKAPADYTRKQTLTNGERYITAELKQYEEKVLHAEDKIYELESQIFNELRLFVASFTEQIQRNAQLVAQVDALLSLGVAAAEYRYTKPVVDESGMLFITNGRHPVLEQSLPPGQKFQPNSCKLDPATEQIIILTGPNMAGKSVYLRQMGLIVLMAQIGSFVPAESAVIGVVDRIFTRVGASDNITAGESTFLVEMHEAANILNNCTEKSLLLLDEIGRGTSTFDGISIAWSITEYLHENPARAAKTLFATHYHELNELADIFSRIKNYKVEVREYDDKVIFLHKVSPGQADHSYGIQVAQMAGLPLPVTERAKEILANLEGKELTPYEMKKAKIARKKVEDDLQYNLFEIRDDAIRKEISSLEIENLTPLQALQKLNDLKKRAEES